MPAALRHIDFEEEAVLASPAVTPDAVPQPAAAATATQIPVTEEYSENGEGDHRWSQYADYAVHFSGTQEIVEKRNHRRKQARAQRPFRITSGTLAVAVVLCELLGLVGLRAMDLQAVRERDAVKREINSTNEMIARTEKQISALNSSPHLARWAGEMGFRQAQINEYDDVTSNTPLPAAPSLDSSHEATQLASLGVVR